MDSYLEFRVIIGNWSAEVDDPLSGTFDVIIVSELGEPDSIIRTHLDWNKIRPYLLSLKGKKIDNDETKKLRETLFVLLFPGNAKQSLEQILSISREREKLLRIRLDILSDRLTALPWELAQLSDGSILGFHPLISIVRHSRTSYGWISKGEPRKNLRFLLVGSDSVKGFPEINASSHVLKLEENIKKACKENQIDVEILSITKKATIREFSNALNQKWDVVHFAGHGYITNKGPALVFMKEDSLEPDYLTGDDIGALLLSASPRIVNLLACHSGQSTLNGKSNGIAGILVKAGLPAVLAMQDAIQPDIAYLQSQIIYSHLLAGGDLERAVILSRLALIQDKYFVLDWAIPVLHMNYSDEEYYLLPKNKDKGIIKSKIKNLVLGDSATLVEIKNNMFGEFELIVEDFSLKDNSVGFEL